MARPLRIERENTFYHVLSRGNEKRLIFRDDVDRRHFLKLLGTCADRFDLEIWSYVLMPNHYHLLVKTRQANLSRAIQWLGVSYSVWHNARHNRSGHLFQGRFKSFLIEEERYLYRLILYIHRNPIRAGIVDSLFDHEWSSYRCLGHRTNCRDWLTREKTLAYFDGKGEQLLKAVDEYDEEQDNLMKDLRYGMILGSDEVVERLKKEVESSSHREKPQGRMIRGHGTIEECLERYSAVLSLTSEDIESFRKPIRHQRRPLRDVVIYLLWKEGKFSLNEMGKYFNVGYTAVRDARVRGQDYLNVDEKLRRSVQALVTK